MSQESERLHRQDPAREGPNREFSSYVRSQAMGGRPTGDDPVTQGVKLGYSVLDEQMRERRRLAERLRGGLRPGAATGPEFGALIERALNIYRDMGALAFAAAEALAGASSQRGAKPEPAPVQASPYSIEVKSSRRVNVKLDLRGPARAPRVGPLQPALGGGKPIESVGFEAGAAEPKLALEIADDQPAGVYNAVVVDADSGEALGTLTVRITA
jgi:hypothetical protein